MLRKLLAKPQNAASVSGGLSLLTHITENSHVLLHWTALGLQHTQHTELPVLRGLSKQQATQHTEVRAEPNKLVSQYSFKSSLPGPQF